MRLSAVLLLLCLFAGCHFPVREYADRAVCDLASMPMDQAATREPKPAVPEEPAPKEGEPKPLSERLKIPKDLPGSSAPPIKLPGPDPNHPKAREEAINKLFFELPSLGEEGPGHPGPDGKALTLSDLQRLALENSPDIRQAAADVESARGAAIQAGLCPNPSVGYQADTMNTGGTPGYQGGFIEQQIKTGGKLKLAQAAALQDVRNAELALRKAQAELAADVREGYFAVLVATKNVSVARALASFNDEVYRLQIEQVKGAQAAAYEPLQARVLALQARGNLVQARNQLTSAWKQLAATLGLPGMPRTQLEGEYDMPIPLYRYDRLLAHVLTYNTDVLTAETTIQKSRYQLRLAQVTPVPDVDVRLVMQKDFTTPPFMLNHSFQIGIPVPVFDRNQGNIRQAEGGLLNSTEESHRVRNDLTSKLASAFEKYENNRILLDYYRRHILPDQVRVYRGIYERHQQEPDRINFNDVITSQQTLANAVTTYMTTLAAQWNSVVEISRLLQTNDLFQLADGAMTCNALPDLELLKPLPCCHPCNELGDPKLKAGDGNWPPAIPAIDDKKNKS